MSDTVAKMLEQYHDARTGPRDGASGWQTEEDEQRATTSVKKKIQDICFPSLPALVRKACEMYHEDTLAPSVITSSVRGEWYVSVVRWRGPRKELTRQVLFGVTNADLETAYAEALRRLS